MNKSVNQPDILNERLKLSVLKRKSSILDVITAYKGVVKEKEALESSIKVLSQTKSRGHLDVPHSRGPASDTASDRGQDESDRETDDSNKEDKGFVDPLNVTNESQVYHYMS